jgi:hypothetical protein
MNFNNFKTTATWPASTHIATTWRRDNPSPHYIFQLPFLSCVNVEPDELHVVHLGSSTHLLGSALHMLTYGGILKVPPEEAMERVWNSLVKSYKRHRVKTQYSSIELKSFANKQAPKLHYPHLRGKAAEVKDLCLPMKEAWEEHMDRRNATHRRVLTVLTLQVEFQEILSEHSEKTHLPRAAAESLRSKVHQWLREYSALASQSDREGKLLFALVPKHHYLYHLADRALWLNPRRSCCFVDEDFVGVLKNVVAASSFGSEPHHVPGKVMEKYVWGFAVLDGTF